MLTKSSVYVTAVLLFTMIFALAGCGGTSAPQNGKGGVSAKLVWSGTKTTGKSVASAPAGVSVVRLAISGTGMTTISQDFPAADGQGTLTSVPTGSGLTLTASGLDASGTVIYQGSVGSVTVLSGITTDAGTITMTAVTPPNATSIIGTWGVYGDPNGLTTNTIITFVDSTHYMLVSTGPADSYSSPGLEYGTYTYDAATGTGVFGNAPIFDTNGESGASHPPVGTSYTIAVSGDILTVSNTVEGNHQLPRLQNSATNPMVGAWWGSSTDFATGKAGGVLITFLDDTHCLFAQAGSSNGDYYTGGMDGIELGTYAIDSNNIISFSLVVDTNGDWGLWSLNNHLTYPISVSGNSLTIDGNVIARVQ